MPCAASTYHLRWVQKLLDDDFNRCDIAPEQDLLGLPVLKGIIEQRQDEQLQSNAAVVLRQDLVLEELQETLQHHLLLCCTVRFWQLQLPIPPLSGIRHFTR